MFREELIMSVQSEDIAYHHRQSPSWRVLIIISLMFLFIFIIAFHSVIAWVSTLIVLIVATLFWGLTVEVNRDMVQLYYGFGIIHRSIHRLYWHRWTRGVAWSTQDCLDTAVPILAYCFYRGNTKISGVISAVRFETAVSRGSFLTSL